MKIKTRIDHATENAILKSANLFTPHWGNPEQSENGSVCFQALPENLSGLYIAYSHGKRLLGGNCHMQFCLTCTTDWVECGEVVFKGKKFVSKKRDGQLNQIISKLNGDTKLIDSLRRFDLEALTLRVADARLEVVLTPYGGGLAYLVIPPVRYPVPFPPDQVELVEQILERLVQLLGNTHNKSKSKTICKTKKERI